jgi:AraC-like DNA-binding protein
MRLSHGSTFWGILNHTIMVFYVKNMVCDRCKMVVRQLFSLANFQVQQVQLGEVEVAEPVTSTQIKAVAARLQEYGFELLEDKRVRTVEKIKTTVLELIRTSSLDLKVNFSNYLAEKLHRDYNGLSTLFSSLEGMTIEQYTIRQKIERAKELLAYDELSLSQIADELHYSSVAHLSNQFKKITGMTPSQFKQLAHKNRQPLDVLGDK